MEHALFEQYVTAKAQGEKRLASHLIARFIATFSTDEERETWTRWYLDSRTGDRRIRHELFEHVIFPVLLAGYQRSDLWCLEMLDRYAQNLYRAQHLWARVGYRTDVQFAQQRLALAPHDGQARARVLQHWIGWFGHSEHEWPTGILYGMDGATEQQCAEILAQVHEVRALDQEGRYRDYLDQFEAKVRQYLQRLSDRSAAGGASPTQSA
ncbi:hypothetical protein [Tahibacter harae]|uniref:Uncharacterized protein n=1 Tax=Tahibacter harae TaxID=2963937 RepID=A0ABT1QUX6_9GAMM|nr:hypothetical protein [Tahibacter harae]MCQ4166094.1 hypothetical protein [Tahibacter harae]